MLVNTYSTTRKEVQSEAGHVMQDERSILATDQHTLIHTFINKPPRMVCAVFKAAYAFHIAELLPNAI